MRVLSRDAVSFLALMGLVHVPPASAFAPPRPVSDILTRRHSSYLLDCHAKPSMCRSWTSARCDQKRTADETKDRFSPPTIGPSIFFLGFSAMLSDLCFKIQQSSLPVTIGTSSLYFVSAFVAFDNLIIGIGDIFFPNARTNEKEYDILKLLSYPRFVFHASGVPVLFVTVAEIGKAARVEWLQSEIIQNCIVAAAVVVALVSRIHFFRSPGIELADTSDSPPNALERKLLWFTYKEPDFLYVLPSLLLALASLAVGVSAFRMKDTDAHAAGVLLMVSSIGVLAGNAQKSYVARFTGNFAEVIMLWNFFVAESFVI